MLKRYLEVSSENYVSSEDIISSVLTALKKVGQATGLMNADIVFEITSNKYNCEALVSYAERSERLYYGWHSKELYDFLTTAYIKKDLSKAKSDLERDLVKRLKEIDAELTPLYKEVISGPKTTKITLSRNATLEDLRYNKKLSNLTSLLEGFRFSMTQDCFQYHDDMVDWVMEDWLSDKKLEYTEDEDEFSKLYDNIAYGIITKYNKELYNKGKKLLDPIVDEISIYVYREGDSKDSPNSYDKKTLMDLFDKLSYRDWKDFKLLKTKK